MMFVINMFAWIGGDLANCTAVLDLFGRAGYTIHTTAANSSHQNAPVKWPHQTIGDAMRSMLSGAALDHKFWPYAFQHFLRLYNFTVHSTKTQSTYTICSGGRLPNLQQLRTFGCQVYTVPCASCPAKLDNNA
jgi:hypothetical protein